MNQVNMIGRLTRDPEVKYTTAQLAYARFTIAIDRPTKKGEEKQADFPTIVAFGKQAENIGLRLNKGSKVGISGRLQTGSYEKADGTKVYTTEVIANNVEFLDPKGTQVPEERMVDPEPPEGFAQLDEDVPF